MTLGELVDQLGQLSATDEVEVLIGSWDGCVDTLQAVAIDRFEGKPYVLISADGFKGNRT